MTTPTQAQIEAVKKEYINRCGYYRLPSDETFAALTAAAQVKPTVRDLMDDPVKALNTAAQVGEPVSREPGGNEFRVNREKDTRNATIERCAQVAASFGGHNVPLIAAAIRKLKDMPAVDPNIIHPGKDPDFVFPEEEP